jgi:Ca2+-binding RTX toxin-like protein
MATPAFPNLSISVTDNVSPQTGNVAYGSYTNDPSPIVHVSLNDVAAAGETLTLGEIESPLTHSVTLTASDVAQGYVDIAATGLLQGWNQLQATLAGPDGSEIGYSSYIAVGLATTAPAAPVVTAVMDDSGASPVAVADGGHTHDSTPVFHISEAGLPPAPTSSPGHPLYFGPAIFGGHVELLENGQVVGDATLSFAGDVTLTSGALSAGDHTLVLVAVDRAGNVSAESAPFHLTIDAGDPTSPTQPATGADAGDVLQATAAMPNVTGGAEGDTITGADVSGVLRGAGGNDSIVGGAHANIINGNQGADTIIGHSTVGDLLLGGQGADVIDASQSTGHNIVNGNLGADTITGGDGSSILFGGQGDDVITGGASADFLSGDRGSNTLTGGGGGDWFHAGPGIDHVTDFSQAQGDHIVIDPGVDFSAAQVGQDTVISLSNGGQMTLVGVQYAGLTGGWIVHV